MIRDGSYVKIGGSRSHKSMRKTSNKGKKTNKTNKKSLYKLLSKKNRTLKAGCGCDRSQSGGRVMKPAEFYGGNSSRYFASGAKELVPADHAYGKTRAVSFGEIANDMKTSGPNLGPYPNSSGMMTGGSNKVKKGKSSRRGKKGKKGKKSNKSRKCKK